MTQNPAPAARTPDEVYLLRILNVIMRRRRVVVGTAFLAFFLVAVTGIWQRHNWSSSATLVPETRSLPSGISGLAAQFGFTLPGTAPTQSPAFYADLVKSRTILRETAQTRYSYHRDGQAVSGTLADIYDIRNKNDTLRLEGAIRLLDRAVTATTNAKTGVIKVVVALRDPELSQAVLLRLIELLNRFNLETRQSQAAAQRRFVEQQADTSRLELRDAEGRLQDFLDRNREYRNSPTLTFQQDRLSRDVTMRQQIYTTLAQSLEQARIEEVRDTPVLTVIEPPEVPVKPDPRGLLLRSLAALIIGSVLGMGIALIGEGAGRARQYEPEDYAEFRQLRERTLADLRHPWRLLSLRRSVDEGTS